MVEALGNLEEQKDAMEVLGEASEVESSLDMVPDPVEEVTTSIDANSEAYVFAWGENIDKK